MRSNAFINFLSFNKKFSLNITLIDLLSAFVRGTDEVLIGNYNEIYYPSQNALMSFLTTNFLLSDKIEQHIEKSLLSSQSKLNNNMNGISSWKINNDDLKEGQLLKTCVTLSPEGTAIFSSVANISTPTDIMSWLELSKDHFTKKIPAQLVAKFGNKIADYKRIHSLITTGIEYYQIILSAAEPFSNKLNTSSEGEDE